MVLCQPGELSSSVRLTQVSQGLSRGKTHPGRGILQTDTQGPHAVAAQSFQLDCGYHSGSRIEQIFFQSPAYDAVPARRQDWHLSGHQKEALRIMAVGRWDV